MLGFRVIRLSRMALRKQSDRSIVPVIGDIVPNRNHGLNYNVFESGFFSNLASRRVFKCFSEFQMPARDFMCSGAVIRKPFAKQNLSVPNDDNPYPDFWPIVAAHEK